ncbi:methyltransferase [Paucibacter soli]|uniref:methyltransferase n=1 Tax=Paucibacter soli TaxID=3133433 RepID=UPI003096BC10
MNAPDLSPRNASARQQLVRQITACWRSQALYSAVQLELPERLAEGCAPLAALAQACQCDADALARLLRALCVLRVCRQRRDGGFELTAAGAALCRHPPDGGVSMRAMALWWGGPLWPMWGELSYSVRTGHSARARQTGHSHYHFLDGHPDAASIFHEAMAGMTSLVAPAVARLESWHGARSLVDVGGGSGTLGAAIATAHPQLQLIVFDREHAEPGALALLRAQGLSGRARFVAGDFFAALPPHADRYLLKSILHNWDDAACRRVLACCAEAALPEARLLLVERVRAERMRPTVHDEALVRTDLNMLAGLGGRERSLREYRDLLTPAGFEIADMFPTPHEFSVIEARRR